VGGVNPQLTPDVEPQDECNDDQVEVDVVHVFVPFTPSAEAANMARKLPETS
jgi:hypothetical protein